MHHMWLRGEIKIVCDVFKDKTLINFMLRKDCERTVAEKWLAQFFAFTQLNFLHSAWNILSAVCVMVFVNVKSISKENFSSYFANELNEKKSWIEIDDENSRDAIIFIKVDRKVDFLNFTNIFFFVLKESWCSQKIIEKLNYFHCMKNFI